MSQQKLRVHCRPSGSNGHADSDTQVLLTLCVVHLKGHVPMLATAGEECTEAHTPVSQYYHLEVTDVSSTHVYNQQKNKVVLCKKMGATRDYHIK